MIRPNEINRKSIIFFTIIGIASVLLAVIGTTFAYFTITIEGNTNETNVRVKSVSLGVLMFKYGNMLLYDNAIPGRPKWNENEIPKNILNFSLTSSTSMDQNEKVKYNLYFNIIEDTFETENLVFLTTGNKGKYSGDLQMKFGDEEDSYKKSYIPYENGLPKENEGFLVGYIPESLSHQTEEQKILIGSGEIGGMGSCDEWTFEVWLDEIGREQNIDQGKILKGYITAEAEAFKLTNEPDKIKN